MDTEIPGNRGICDPKASFGERFDSASWAKGCMPVYRWKDAASSFHSDLPSGAMNWLRYTPGIMTQEMVMSIGNALWSATVAATEWASALNPIETAGLQVDKMAASLGNALLDSPLLAGLVGVGVIAALWGAWRGRGMGAWKDLVRALLVIGLMGGMVAGATASAHGPQRPDSHGQTFTPTVFGKFSPAWFASTLSKIINSTSDQIANAILVEDYKDDQYINGDGNCEQYRIYLKSVYAEVLTGRATAIPLALSAAWERTGLAAWKVNQFGYDRNMEDNAYCHLLEWNAGIRGKDQYRIFNAATADTWPPLDGIDQNLSLAFNPGLSTEDDDEDESYGENTSASLVGWAACKPNSDKTGVVMRAEWQKAFDQGQGSGDKDCENWWGKEENHWKKGKGLAIKRSPNQIMGALPGYKAGQDYVGFMQGVTRISAMSTPFIYVLSSLVNLIVFGGLALVVAIASVGVAVLAAVSLLALFISAMPGRVGGEVPKRFLKMWVSYTLVAWGYSSIMGLIVVITGLLDNLAMGSVGGYGSAGNMLIAAFTPLAAVFVLKQFFTKLLGMPNPFSLKNAVAAAGLGTVAGAAMGMGRRAVGGAKGMAGRLAGHGKGGGGRGSGHGAGGQDGGGGPQGRGMSALADRQRGQGTDDGMNRHLPKGASEEAQFKRWNRTRRAKTVGRGVKAAGAWAAGSTLGRAAGRTAKAGWNKAANSKFGKAALGKAKAAGTKVGGWGKSAAGGVASAARWTAGKQDQLHAKLRGTSVEEAKARRLATSATIGRGAKKALRGVTGVDMNSEEWKTGGKFHRAAWMATGVGKAGAKAAALGFAGTALGGVVGAPLTVGAAAAAASLGRGALDRRGEMREDRRRSRAAEWRQDQYQARASSAAANAAKPGGTSGPSIDEARREQQGRQWGSETGAAEDTARSKPPTEAGEPAPAGEQGESSAGDGHRVGWAMGQEPEAIPDLLRKEAQLRKERGDADWEAPLAYHEETAAESNQPFQQYTGPTIKRTAVEPPPTGDTSGHTGAHVQPGPKRAPTPRHKNPPAPHTDDRGATTK